MYCINGTSDTQILLLSLQRLHLSSNTSRETEDYGSVGHIKVSTVVTVTVQHALVLHPKFFSVMYLLYWITDYGFHEDGVKVIPAEPVLSFGSFKSHNRQNLLQIFVVY